MAVLPDSIIQSELTLGNLVIEPLGDNAIQPASVDLRLDGKVKIPCADDQNVLNLWETKPRYFEKAIPKDGLMLFVGEFVLASTVEWVEIPPYLTANVEGKSTLRRGGLIIQTAGRIDPGFRGNITLELYNCAPYAILLVPGKPICQLVLTRLELPAQRPYGAPELGSHYQGQCGPTAGRVG